MAASSTAVARSRTSPGPEWDGYAHLHGRRQALCIQRERHILKTGRRSVEVSYSLTSLGPDSAGPEELLSLVRNHWHIENRLHYVRDFTCDEDRCRVYVRHLPRNLACLTNLAIAIVRSNGRFRYLPEANRATTPPAPGGSRRGPDRAHRLIPASRANEGPAPPVRHPCRPFGFVTRAEHPASDWKS